mgnify:CR=1 FL=1
MSAILAIFIPHEGTKKAFVYIHWDLSYKFSRNDTFFILMILGYTSCHNFSNDQSHVFLISCTINTCYQSALVLFCTPLLIPLSSRLELSCHLLTWKTFDIDRLQNASNNFSVDIANINFYFTLFYAGLFQTLNSAAIHVMFFKFFGWCKN